MFRVADAQKAFPIHSEDLEPTFALIIGKLFARAQMSKESGDSHSYVSALQTLWLAMDTMSSLTTCCATCTHASIAVNNHIVQMSRYIQEEIGVDPMSKDAGFGW